MTIDDMELVAASRDLGKARMSLEMLSRSLDGLFANDYVTQEKPIKELLDFYSTHRFALTHKINDADEFVSTLCED